MFVSLCIHQDNNMSIVHTFSNINLKYYKKCTDLTISMKYPIMSMKNEVLKYEPANTFIIQGAGDSKKELKLYLPQWYAEIITDEELERVAPSAFLLNYSGLKDRIIRVKILQWIFDGRSCNFYYHTVE